MKDSVQLGGARLIRVIEVSKKRGDGTTNNPSRQVTEYWSTNGDLLAVKDEWLSHHMRTLPDYNLTER